MSDIKRHMNQAPTPRTGARRTAQRPRRAGKGGGVPKELGIGVIAAAVLLVALFFGLRSCSGGSTELYSGEDARLTIYSVEGTEIGRYDGDVTLVEEDGTITLSFDDKVIATVGDAPDGSAATNDGGSATE